MKNKEKRNTAVKLGLAALALFLLFAGMATLYGVLPGAVCYSVNAESKSENAMQEVRLAISEPDIPYKSVGEIPFANGFVIKSEKDSIYVFKGNKALYRINASLSEFPESDMQIIKEGFDVESKQKLHEIVQYLES